MRRRAALVAAFLATVVLAPAAGAQNDIERILDFSSDITVQRNGNLNVAETIAVNAQGDNIRHGIYRDFPTIYTDKFGRRVRVRFDVQSVTMDGHDEQYEVDSIDNGKRVKIGDPDVLLDYGRHTFVIRYVTDRQIGFFRDYDELYWNVTGNGWDFQIDQAEATIHLPQGAHILQEAFYTGPEGAAGKQAQARSLSENEIAFATTAPLYPREGLTIAVGFNKGAVSPPTSADRFWDFLRDNAATIIALIGLIGLFFYYLVTWVLYGRDPAHGTIIPLFAPPSDFSPAAARYVHRMAYDRKCYAASLIDMAVKGYLTISETGSTYTLKRTGKSESECGLFSGEKSIGSQLFDSATDSIELKQVNHTDIAASISALQSSLKNEYEKKYFVTNFGWFLGGVLILAVTAIVASLSSDAGAGSLPGLIWVAAWSGGTAFLVWRAVTAWNDAIHAPRGRAGKLAGAIFLTVFAVPFVAGDLIGFVVFASTELLPAMIIVLIGGVLVAVFHHLLKAPTALGGHIRDELDGFKIFLETAEKDRLEKLNPPQITPKVFEKFLPYAIALDCENQWSKKFEAEAAAAAAADRSTYSGYTPLWYSGNSFNNLGAAGFASAIGASLASSAASASTAPGSSSGSGGGGFSGGGGGGGGGGGW